MAEGSSTVLLLACYALLILSIVSLWYSNRIWLYLTTVSVILAYCIGHLSIQAVLAVILLAAACLCINKGENRFLQSISWAIVILIPLLMGFGIISGFNEWKVAENVLISSNGNPFTFKLEMTKPLIAIFLLSSIIPLAKKMQDWKSMLAIAAPILSICILTIGITSVLIGYAKFDFKIAEYFFLWFITNLFITCVGEEAFFRGLVQKKIESFLSRFVSFGKSLSLIISSVVFGLAHFGGGIAFVFLATISGFFYGYVFQKTGKIEASIFCHFGLNLFHFIFLTYPSLAP